MCRAQSHHGVSGGERSGTVLGRKIDDPKASVDLRRHVAYVSEDKRLYAYMTVRQIIRFTRSFYPDWRTDVEQTLLRSYELPPDRKIRSLSKGMRTKLAKDGPRLKTSASGGADCRKSASDGELHVICTNMGTADLAAGLPGLAPGYINQPVSDLTAISGTWDFVEEKGGLAIFDALTRQLGLKLKHRKLPVGEN